MSENLAAYGCPAANAIYLYIVLIAVIVVVGLGVPYSLQAVRRLLTRIPTWRRRVKGIENRSPAGRADALLEEAETRMNVSPAVGAESEDHPRLARPTWNGKPDDARPE